MGKRIFILLVCFTMLFLLVGCGGEHDSEEIQLYGKTNYTDDNINIICPDGYFCSGYEFVSVDDGKMDLVIHLWNK